MTWLFILGWLAKFGIGLTDIEDAFMVVFRVVLISVLTFAFHFFWPIMAGSIGVWMVHRSLAGHATCDMRRSRQMGKALVESEHQLAASRAEVDDTVMSPFHRAPWDYTGLGGY